MGECSECNEGYRVVDGTCVGKNTKYFIGARKPVQVVLFSRFS